jgi:hypothetical protein
LKDIVVDEGTLEPAFNPAIKEYQVNVEYHVNTVSINGIPNSSYASVSGNVNAQSLDVGDNVINITVMSGFGNERKYKVTVTRLSKASSISPNPVSPVEIVQVISFSGAIVTSKAPLIPGIYLYILKTDSGLRKEYRVIK